MRHTCHMVKLSISRALASDVCCLVKEWLKKRGPSSLYLRARLEGVKLCGFSMGFVLPYKSPIDFLLLGLVVRFYRVTSNLPRRTRSTRARVHHTSGCGGFVVWRAVWCHVVDLGGHKMRELGTPRGKWAVVAGSRSRQPLQADPSCAAPQSTKLGAQRTCAGRQPRIGA